jgi:hypothetical protein
MRTEFKVQLPYETIVSLHFRGKQSTLAREILNRLLHP